MRRPSPTRPTAALRLEPLEDRWVPATVTNLDDDGPGSLRDAIAATPAGGTVDFQSGLNGTVNLTSATLTVDKDLTIAGLAGTLIVAGNQQFGIFTVASPATVTISGLTITGGRAPTGGGILNHGTLTLSRVFVNQNTADGDGGGIASDGTLTVMESLISMNTAVGGETGTGRGGGIDIAAGSLTLIDTTVSLNQATGPTVSGSGGHGGGVAVRGSAQIRGSTLFGNTATAGIDGGGSGGGIESDGPTTLVNCTFTQNTAVSGGGINQRTAASTLTLVNCTVAGNTATSGGGLANPDARPLSLTNTIVATNTESGGESTTQDIAGVVSAADHALIGVGDPASGVADGVNGNQVGTLAEPIDPALGPLTTDNGGLTPTMALLAESPALGAGSNAAVTAANFPGGPPFFDQRGDGFARIASGTVDIGAIETQSPVVVAPATLPNGTVGVAYSQTITASGVAGPFTFTVTSGTLPGGLSLSTSGTLSGTPTIDGAFNFTVTATNEATESGSQPYTLTIDPGTSPPPPPPPPPPGDVGRPRQLSVGGSATGTANRFAPSGGVYANPPTATTPAVFGGFAGEVRPATGDFNADGFEDTVLVTGPGIKTVMAVVSGRDNAVLLSATDPFGDPNFTFGGFVTSGDIDADGRWEWVVTPELRGGPRVIIFQLLPDGSFDVTSAGQPSLVANFFGIGDPNFRDGDRAALGDVNGDGTLDVFSIAAFNGGPRTALYDGRDVLVARAAGRDPVKLVGDFFAAPSGADEGRGGRSIAVGDINGDGLADLIATGDNQLGTGNQIVVFSGADLIGGRFPGFGATPLANFAVSGQSAAALVSVAAVDADGDARADLAVGSGAGQSSLVKMYFGTNLTGTTEPASTQFDPFGTVTLNGVFVG